jgi:hypothetical protein
MKSSRHSFLKAGLALPAVLNSVPSLTVALPAKEIIAIKDSSFDPCGASVYDLTLDLNPLLPRRIV